ncbi:MAG: hypothetical protein ACQETQ_07260 [Spirochaetota bacterium]
MRLLVLPLLLVGLGMVCAPTVAASTTEDDVEATNTLGGFKIATPPLGYPYYTDDVEATRNRLMLGFTRYDNDELDMHGVSLHLLNRLTRGTWGALSLKYGGFYATGQELDAVQTETAPGSGEWESDGDFDLTVYGGELEVLLEVAAVNRRGSRGFGYKLIPFMRLDTGIQLFDQETAEETYASYIVGGTVGMQAHLATPGGVTLSPFFSATALNAVSSSSAVGDHLFLWPSYGFDLVYQSFSLSGILQPLLGPAGVYTVSLGFGF